MSTQAKRNRTQTNIRIYMTIAVMILLVSSICCACNAYDSNHQDDAITPYDENGMQNSEKFSEITDQLYGICAMQPETLAATMSAFPRLLEQVGIIMDDPDTAPMSIDELLDGEDGGTVQLSLLKALKVLLSDPNTRFASGQWTGSAKILCMGLRDADTPSAPDNVYLYWDDITLDQVEVFGIVTGSEPENYEFAYFYVEGGFQRFVPVISGT